MDDHRPEPREPPDPAKRNALLSKLAIWGLFFVLLYLLRDFFFTIFLTFMMCYLTLALVDRAMRRLSPGQDKPWLRRLLTVGVFVLTPVVLLAVGAVVGPRLLQQGQQLAGWASHIDPQAEVSLALERFVGPAEFKRQFGGPGDPRYQKALDEFRGQGATHVQAYRDFPQVEGWVEGSFGKTFTESQTSQLKTRLAREGPSSTTFAAWFLNDKVPELKTQAEASVPDTGRPPAATPPLVVAAATESPEQLLAHVRRDPSLWPALRKEWIDDTLRTELPRSRETPAYLDEMRAFYEHSRQENPKLLPYTFDQYQELRRARLHGMKAFGDVMDTVRPSDAAEPQESVRANFEAAKQHQLFQHWWNTSTIARAINHRLDGSFADGQVSQIDGYLSGLVNIPFSVTTAMLLSLFICIDFPNLKRGVRTLRDTPLRTVYDEMAPAFSRLGRLIGRSMQAQGLIAVCNATMMFVALTVLGVAHPLLLSTVVFVLCLVPTLGLFLAWILIAAVALVQPGGGMGLVFKTTLAVVVVSMIETFVLSPRILGRMMELHPVLIIAILPLAHYFFGVWGLILATPVAVYVIHVLILGHGDPGQKPVPTATTPTRPAPEEVRA